MSCLAERQANTVRPPSGLAKKKESHPFLAQDWMKVCMPKKKSLRTRSHSGLTLQALYLFQGLAGNARRMPATKAAWSSCLLSMWKLDAGCCHQKRVPRPLQTKKRLDCGQAAAYPQDAMCRTALSWKPPFFFQHRCRLDTILVQLLWQHVNC